MGCIHAIGRFLFVYTLFTVLTELQRSFTFLIVHIINWDVLACYQSVNKSSIPLYNYILLALVIQCIYACMGISFYYLGQ